MENKKILVTGGAGYIGSHTVKNLLKEGFSVVVVDNLSSGFIEPIEILKNKFNDLEFIKQDLGNKSSLDDIFQKHKIEAVMHFAAKISIDESIKNPELYHRENYINSVKLIESMLGAGVNNFIFSSSCVVYGNPRYLPIDESHPTNPQSPYGKTKLDFEKYLKKTSNLKYLIFRYFNVGGSDPELDIGKSNVDQGNLLSNIMKVVLGQMDKITIYGNDYDTSDGTPIRDFLHVEDIANAHILGLNKISETYNDIFNLGSESGFTVKEIIDKASIIIGKEIPVQIGERRPGDVPKSVSSAKKAKNILGWNSRCSDLETIIKTDWLWRKKHPSGYQG